MAVMDKKEILKNAIVNNDMGVIESYYSLIYEEDPPKRKENDIVMPVDKTLKKVFDNALDNMHHLQDLIYGNVDEYEGELDELNKDLKEPIGVTEKMETATVVDTSISPAESENGTVLVSSNDYSFPEFDNQEYKDAMDKHSSAKQRAGRPAYEPNIKACEVCKAEFDFNKEYPAGRLESSSKIRCNRCRTHGA
tara:strand:- start:1768 stop:2349 length:582 start_codon:yes stop_codon:yes gene_type:complete